MRERVAGRVVGKRKSSKNLMFFDLASNGRSVQVMLDSARYEGAELSEIKASISRGCFIGVEGTPLRTDAGELSIGA